MGIRKEVIPFLLASLVIGAAAGFLSTFCSCTACCPITPWFIGGLVTLILGGYMCYFFRDPPRRSPNDPSVIVAAADGTVARIVDMREDKYLNTNTVRVSIFLSLVNVHVNRSPIAGRSKFLGYFPGKRLFTFQEKSSDVNQHNAILITGQGIRCLVKQIVGPVCRRVVYWPSHTEETELPQGAPIGMMKFGSRLDMYFPRDCVEITAKIGDVTTAGETIIARIIKKETA